MKKFLLLFAIIATSSVLHCQQLKSVENSSNCDLRVTMYYGDEGACQIQGSYTYNVAANGGYVNVNAPSGQWLYASIVIIDCPSYPPLIVGDNNTCTTCSYPASASNPSYCRCALTADWEQDCGQHLSIY